MISREQLAQLNASIQLPGSRNLKRAMVTAARLGREVCENISMHRAGAGLPKQPKKSGESYFKPLDFRAILWYACDEIHQMEVQI